MVKPMNQRLTQPSWTILICVSMTLGTLALYGQVVNHYFVSYDDYEYVLENPFVREGLTKEGMLQAFRQAHAGNWHPVTWLSHMLDCELFGLNPGAHHFNSVLIHVVNSLLLFMILKGMTGTLWRSALVAALFALHPLHVESVAWIAERKDVLSTLFWMLSVMAYVHYVKYSKRSGYWWSMGFLALGLLSKPMVVTLPLILLLLDYWPLGRFQSDGKTGDLRPRLTKAVKEKIPLLLLSALSSLVTLTVQAKWGAMASTIPFKARLANAVCTYLIYIKKMIFPTALSIYYPHPGPELPAWKIVISLLLLIGISMVALRSARRLPFLTVGWFWYIITLVPVIGLVQVGTQAMADRYTYVPLIGLFIILSWGSHRIQLRRPVIRTPIYLGFSILILVFAMSSWIQIRTWRNSVTLFAQAVKVTNHNFVAHNNLGNALAREGRLHEALNHYTEALRLRPNDAVCHNNLANVLLKQGKFQEAFHHYSEALRIRPDFEEARYNLGMALRRMQESLSR
jgi:hypothetical protein